MIKAFLSGYFAPVRVTLFFLFAVGVCYGQQLRWVYKIGGLTAETGVAVHLDNDENIFDLTNFQGNVAVSNEISVTATGGTDILLRKSTSLGALLWIKKIGGKGMDTGYDVVTDVFGNCFVVGSFQDSLFFDGQFVMAVQNKTAGFVLRISGDGTLLSSFLLEGTQSVIPKSVSISPGSQLIISGNFDGMMDADPGMTTYPLNAGEGSDIFIGRYTFGGVMIWAYKFGNNDHVNSFSHVVDDTGNIFLTGDFRNSLNFITSVNDHIVSSNGLSDIFVAKLGPDGQTIWAKGFGGPGLDNGYALTLDHQENLLVTGRYSNTVQFNPGFSTGTVSSNGSGDVFVLKLNENGDFVWVTSLGGISNDTGRSITVNNNGIIFVGGNFRESVVFNPANAPATTQQSMGGDDNFYLVLNQDGTYNDHFVIGGLANEQLNDLVLRQNGELISVGAFGAIVDFDPSAGVINIISTGGLDAFMLNFFICVNPYLKDLRVVTPQICHGERGIVQIAEGYLNGASQWSWQRNDCSSITFASGDFIDLRLTQDMAYFIKGTGGCVTKEICHRADIRVFTDTLRFNFVNLCEGESFTVGQNTYSTPGVYIDSLVTDFGCDSVIISEILVFPRYEYISYDTICHGDSILFGNSFYYNPGIYTINLQTNAGCDSIYTVYLTVIPSVITTQDITICEGDVLFIGDEQYSETGTYTLTMISDKGCEDYLITHLTVLPRSYTQTIQLCEGDSVMVGGNIYKDAGTYVDALTSAIGCDSIITTTIINFPVSLTEQEVTLCQGDSIAVGNHFYFETGLYTDTLQTIQGCDSIIITQINILAVPPVYEFFVDICKGETWQTGNSIYTESGMYLDTLQAANGCDSLVLTHLNVMETFYTQELVICRGDSVMVGDSIYKNPGSYINLFNGSNGCDSILTTYLTVLNPVSVNRQYTVCPGDTVIVGSSVYTLPGIYTDVFTASSNGCDSTVQTTLQWHQTEFEQEFTLCKGQSITIGNNTYDTAGIYVDTLISMFGCQSKVTTTVHISDPNTTIDARICEGETINISNTLFNTSGTYYITLTAANGCDSVITLNLYVIPVIRTEGYLELCKGDSIRIGNTVYYDNAVHTDTTQSTLGCDSLSRVVLHFLEVDTTLTVNGNMLSVIAQDGLQYRWYHCDRPDSTLSTPNQSVFIVTESGEYAAEIIFRGCVFQTRCVSIELSNTEDILHSQVRLFPNPANHTLNLELPQDGYIRITGLDGKMLQSQKVQAGLQTLDISPLTPGSYILRWITDRQQYSIRFVKL